MYSASNTKCTWRNTRLRIEQYHQLIRCKPKTLGRINLCCQHRELSRRIEHRQLIWCRDQHLIDLCLQYRELNDPCVARPIRCKPEPPLKPSMRSSSQQQAGHRVVRCSLPWPTKWVSGPKISSRGLAKTWIELISHYTQRIKMKLEP